MTGSGSNIVDRIAVIDEQLCIGCTLCVQACPVEAIIGSAQRMHTVVQRWCTGCELCVAPCPMDCIELVQQPVPRPWTQADIDQALARSRARQRRLAGASAGPADASADRDPDAAVDDPQLAQRQRKLRTVAAAIERARQRRGSAAAG